jgi:hypothetical protein
VWVEIEVRRLDGWAAPTLSHCLRLDSGGVLSMSIGAGSLGRRWIVLYTAICTLHTAHLVQVRRAGPYLVESGQGRACVHAAALRVVVSKWQADD